jgi:hypothetical protein
VEGTGATAGGSAEARGVGGAVGSGGGWVGVDVAGRVVGEASTPPAVAVEGSDESAGFVSSPVVALYTAQPPKPRRPTPPSPARRSLRGSRDLGFCGSVESSRRTMDGVSLRRSTVTGSSASPSTRTGLSAPLRRPWDDPDSGGDFHSPGVRSGGRASPAPGIASPPDGTIGPGEGGTTKLSGPGPVVFIGATGESDTP